MNALWNRQFITCSLITKCTDKFYMRTNLINNGYYASNNDFLRRQLGSNSFAIVSICFPNFLSLQTIVQFHFGQPTTTCYSVTFHINSHYQFERVGISKGPSLSAPSVFSLTMNKSMKTNSIRPLVFPNAFLNDVWSPFVSTPVLLKILKYVNLFTVE